MVLIDVHCHLEICKDLDGFIERAKEKNVNIIVSSGSNFKTNRQTLKFSKKYDIVKACLGVYPVDALKLNLEELDKEINFIFKNDERIIGIGEVGLDLKHGKDLEKQVFIFEKFIKLAGKLEKPLIVHSREAEKKAIETLERLDAKKVVMHCFCGDLKLVERIIKNGWYLSIPTNIVFNEHFQKIVEVVDIDRLLCETDSPFLHPIKGSHNNESKNVIESYKKIAEIKGLSLKDVEKKIEDNFNNVFE